MHKAALQDQLLSRISEPGAKIVLPEWEDDRIRKAAGQLIAEGVEIVTPADFEHQREAYTTYIRRRAFTRNWPEKLLVKYLENPVNFAAAMVALGDADGMVAGVLTPKEDILRTAIRVLGVSREYRFVFSSIYLEAPDGKRRLSFADCSVVPEPKPLELAAIAGHTALFHHWLTGDEPEVAFISFSTAGELEHYRIERVREAIQKFRRKFPGLRFGGEMQADAALDPDTARRKGTDPDWSGRANVLIFPNLDAGDTAWKITERLAGYAVTGPILHGLNRRLNLVSRGSSVESIIKTVLLTIAERDYHANLQLQM
ncbi:MAG: phosphate acetyltransferase [FCB group bacterium]|nr:phosphate acetyltransferase [FCB group bacterium]